MTQKIQDSKTTFFAPTAKGLEEVLASELRQVQIGATETRVLRAGVEFQGTLETAYRACLWSRVASRVLLPIARFPAADPKQLYGGIRSIRWFEHMSVRSTFAIHVTSIGTPELDHTHFAALKSKDAIVDQFQSRDNDRPSVNVVEPQVSIHVHVQNGQAEVSLDLSGGGLHRRGYRAEGVYAPLKENLAAGLLLMAEWDKKCDSLEAFQDPMCGSGTFLIEGAWIAKRRAPGLSRKHFGFTGWLQHDPKLWDQLKAEAQDRIIRDPKKIPTIVGSDIESRALHGARRNVELAGLGEWIKLARRSLTDIEPARPSGMLVVNPPYGERLGEVEELTPLYSELGDILKKRFSGWEAYVLCGQPDHMKAIGLHPSRRMVAFNGALECRWLKFEMYSGSRKK